MKKMFWLGLAFCLLFGSTLFAEAMEIIISSDPPLPLENLVKNGDFEKGLESWSVLGELEKSKEEGWEVKLSDDAYKGKHSVYIRRKPGATGRESSGIWQNMSSLLSSAKIVPGKSYVVSCWIKSNMGGEDYCGVRANLSLFSHGWAEGVSTDAGCGDTEGKWIKAVSKQPLECPKWAVHAQYPVQISYISGEAWIDEVSLSEAYVDLSIKISGPGILQVIVEDETGKIIFDSERLPKETKEFSKIIKVISAYKYKVKVVDKNGDIYEKEYPNKKANGFY